MASQRRRGPLVGNWFEDEVMDRQAEQFPNVTNSRIAKQDTRHRVLPQDVPVEEEQAEYQSTVRATYGVSAAKVQQQRNEESDVDVLRHAGRLCGKDLSGLGPRMAARLRRSIAQAERDAKAEQEADEARFKAKMAGADDETQNRRLQRYTVIEEDEEAVAQLPVHAVSIHNKGGQRGFGRSAGFSTPIEQRMTHETGLEAPAE